MTKFKKVAFATISTGLLAGAVFASAQTAPTASCFNFTENMKLGSKSSQVLELQKTLNARGFTISTTGVGSTGMETNYFGAKTKAAAVKFQAANNIIQTGNVFALTRAALNVNCTTNPGTGTGTGTTTTSGSVTVALAAAQPNNVLVAGSARAKIADLVFSGNGTVVGVKLSRAGVSDNNTLTNVYLYDAATGARLTDAASILTDGTVNFNNAYGMFTVAGSKTVSVMADIAASTSGQSVGVSLTGYTVSGASAAMVSGVNGPVLPIGSATLATANFGTVTPANTSINAGTTGATVWSSALNVGTRAVNLSTITFKMVGSAPVDSLANVKLYVDGVQFANATSFSANGYVTFNSATPLSLTTGSHTFDVRADVVKGSSRSFYVAIENAGDIAVQDSQIAGANISVKNSSLGTISNLLAGTISISGGSLTISQNSALTTTTLVGGSTNQILGSFKFYGYGEDVKVQYLAIKVASTTAVTPTTTKLNNVTVYVNGGAVSSGVQAILGNEYVISLGSNLIVPAGSSVIVDVKGDLINENNANITAGSFVTSIASTTSTAQGQYSYNSVSVPVATGQTMTVNTGNVSYGATAGFTAANLAKNQTMVKIASFSLQAGSAESINVTNFNVILGGTATPASEYTNLKITDGSQTIVPVAGINNFSVNYVVPAGSTKTIEVWADTLEIANGKTIIASSTVTYRGNVSNVTNYVSATAPTMTAASVTVSNPTLVSGSTLGSRYVIGGNTINSVVTYKVASTNGSATVKDLSFTVTGSGVESLSIGTTTAPVVGGVANFYGINLAVPAGTTGINVAVAVKYSAVTAANQGGVTSGTTNNITLTSMKYTAGGTDTTISPAVAGNTMTLVASVSTVKKTSVADSVNRTSYSGKVGTITVSADAKGEVIISNVPVSIVIPTGATASNFKVYANGTNLVGTTGYVAPTTVTSGFNFGTTGYTISAGGLVTFDIYADYSGATVAGNHDISLGTPANFSWSDSVNATTISTTGPLTGALLNTYNN